MICVVVQPKDVPVWYLPTLAVTHPAKPGKIRLCQDCWAVVDGVSLNSMLISGPDLNSNMVGCLLRTRQLLVAFLSDIGDFFYQVGVTEADTHNMRFFFWKPGEREGPLQVYKMNVHCFGATSSPTSSILAFKRNADDHGHEYDADVFGDG